MRLQVTTLVVYKLCFQAILMTFTCDLKIDLIMFEPYHVKIDLICLWTSSIMKLLLDIIDNLSNFLWDIFDISHSTSTTSAHHSAVFSNKITNHIDLLLNGWQIPYMLTIHWNKMKCHKEWSSGRFLWRKEIRIGSVDPE